MAKGFDDDRFAAVLERFDGEAREALAAAREEAARLGHGHAGTGHLLLGLLRDADGSAARALGSLNVTLEGAREQVQNFGGRGEEGTLDWAPLTPRLARVLELAPGEAARVGHNYVGPEHLLLRLAREANSVAVRALSALGANPADVRREVTRFLHGPPRMGPEELARRTGLPEDATTVIVPNYVVAEENDASAEVAPGPPQEAPPVTFRCRVQALEVHARCGATDEERALPQTLLVDLAYAYEAHAADDLSLTVDYGAVLEEAARALEREEFRLLETGTRRVGERLLREFPAVREIAVTLTKPRVPVARSLSGVAVRATFRR